MFRLHRSFAWRRRSGISSRILVIGLALAAVLPLAAFAVWSKFSLFGQEALPMMHEVERGEFVHEITDRGNVESFSNVEITCEVKSKTSAGTTILKIIPEGEYVQPGTILVQLNSSSLDTDRDKQQIACYKSEALVIQALNTRDTAKITLEEYQGTRPDKQPIAGYKSEAEAIQARNTHETAKITPEEYQPEEYQGGKYKLEEQAIENEIAVAEENYRRAKDYLKYSERLAAKGYVTDLQLEADQFAVEKTESDRKAARLKLGVLEYFTKRKMLKQLQADIDTAEAKLKAEEGSHKLDLKQLAEIQDQLAKCTIRAPEPGQVVYANVPGGRGRSEIIIEEGATVREGQVLIRLPDPKRMQVKAKINESKISQVKPEMPVSIRLDAFPDLKLAGKVEKVSDYPLPTSWFNAAVKDYETVIRIDNPPPGLRPGLTAEVRILIEQRPDVVRVPVQTIFEHGGKYYCVVHDGDGFKSHEVKIGPTNDKFVVVEEELQAGRQIVRNAAAYRDKVDLPKLAAGRPRAGAGGSGMFAQFDKNGDGRIDSSEMPEQMRSRMAAIDSNGDGAIDQGELSAVMARMRQGGGPPGHPPGGPP